MTCGAAPWQWSGCASDVAKSVAGDAFQSIAQSFGNAADHAVTWLWSQLNAATAVHLGGAGFDLELSIVAAITGVVAVGLFVLQVVKSALRREPGGIGRALKGLLVTFLGGGVAIAVVNALLAATDQLCQGVVQVTTGTDLAGLGRLVLGSGAISAAVSGPAGLLLLSLACIVATFVVYVALVLRKVLIVVTAVFAPLAFAGSLADVTASWTRRWIETTVALVVSKLVLVLIFVAGYGILVEGAGQAGSGATQRITQVISGILVLSLAGFAPWLALKVVHFTGDHAHQLHALGSTAAGGVVAGGRMAQKAAPYATSVMGGAGAGAAGAGTSGSARAGGLGAPGLGGPGVGGAAAAGGRGAGSVPSTPGGPSPAGPAGPAGPSGGAGPGGPGGGGSHGGAANEPGGGSPGPGSAGTGSNGAGANGTGGTPRAPAAPSRPPVPAGVGAAPGSPGATPGSTIPAMATAGVSRPAPLPTAPSTPPSALPSEPH